jgi:hypothetical protein
MQITVAQTNRQVASGLSIFVYLFISPAKKFPATIATNEEPDVVVILIFVINDAFDDRPVSEDLDRLYQVGRALANCSGILGVQLFKITLDSLKIIVFILDNIIGSAKGKLRRENAAEPLVVTSILGSVPPV